MSLDERAGGNGPTAEAAPTADAHTAEPALGDRPIAPADHQGHELFDDLKLRVAELDAIAWNLPGRREDLLEPPDSSWPAADGRAA